MGDPRERSPEGRGPVLELIDRAGTRLARAPGGTRPCGIGCAVEKPRVCIFAKPPVAGAVKTRLALGVGVERAAALARAFLDDTVAAVGQADWARAALASTEPVDSDLEVILQGEGDLGARLERVLAQALRDAPFALAIGADAPGLPLRLLAQARAALATADAVVGPADDGGFYLLGLSRCPPGLLAGLPWSEPETCARTLARLRDRGFSPAVIEPWFDVDVAADLDRLRAALARGEIQAPRTALLLAPLPR
ncbi:MAG: hypothetical protein NVSMB23_16000 [Myxococcales bacterium]